MLSSVLFVVGSLAAAQAADFSVSVGALTNGTASLVFDPETITAQPGDTITFQFHPKNHSVTQSTFAAPCTRMPVNATTGVGGVALGFHAATATDATLTTVTMQVNQTAPIWMFCGQTGHCGAGMVFAVNPPATGNTFERYKALALATVTGGAATGTNGTGTGSSSSVGGGLNTGSVPAPTGTTPNTTAPPSGASSVKIATGTLLAAVLAAAIALVA